MKRSFLSRLRRNGTLYLTSALLLLMGIPLYQARVLVPLGYSDALAATGTGRFASYLTWIGSHNTQFLVYRVLLILAFALLLSLPFSLFRIIIAQELMAQQEQAEEEEEAEQEEDHENVDEEPEDEVDEEDDTSEAEESDGLPPYAWRGKGFAVIAAWSGLFGLVAYVLGTVVSTLYLAIVSSGFTSRAPLPGNLTVFLSIFSFFTNTVGIGFLALATLFFGAIIARSGHKLWPGEWVIFGYIALAVAALLSGSAVAVASAPTAGQAPLTAPAILLFALWTLWLSVMLVRLKPEA